jgi:hypothetical protein
MKTLIERIKAGEITPSQALDILAKQIQDNKIQKAKLEEKKDNLDAEYKKLLTDLEAQGVKETDLEQTVTNLETDLLEGLAAVEESLK